MLCKSRTGKHSSAGRNPGGITQSIGLGSSSEQRGSGRTSLDGSSSTSAGLVCAGKVVIHHNNAITKIEVLERITSKEEFFISFTLSLKINDLLSLSKLLDDIFFDFFIKYVEGL